MENRRSWDGHAKKVPVIDDPFGKEQLSYSAESLAYLVHTIWNKKSMIFRCGIHYRSHRLSGKCRSILRSHTRMCRATIKTAAQDIQMTWDPPAWFTCKGNLQMAIFHPSVYTSTSKWRGILPQPNFEEMKTRDKNDKDTTTQLKTLTKLFTDRIFLDRNRGYTQKQMLTCIHIIRKPSFNRIGCI